MDTDSDIVMGEVVGMDWEYCRVCRKFYENLKTHIESYTKNINSSTFQTYDLESMNLIKSTNNIYYAIDNYGVKRKQFSYYGNLKFHVEIPHYVKCQKCGKGFSNRSNMIKHVKSFH